MGVRAGQTQRGPWLQPKEQRSARNDSEFWALSFVDLRDFDEMVLKDASRLMAANVVR